jgi:hypothetical protein
MRGKFMLCIDQFGNKWRAITVKNLREQIGGGRVSRMYRDTKAGPPVHTGYVVGSHWCTAYVPFRGAA